MILSLTDILNNRRNPEEDEFFKEARKQDIAHLDLQVQQKMEALRESGIGAAQAVRIIQWAAKTADSIADTAVHKFDRDSRTAALRFLTELLYVRTESLETVTAEYEKRFGTHEEECE